MVRKVNLADWCICILNGGLSNMCDEVVNQMHRCGALFLVNLQQNFKVLFDSA